MLTFRIICKKLVIGLVVLLENLFHLSSEIEQQSKAKILFGRMPEAI